VARRKRKGGRAAVAEAPAAPMTDVQRAAHRAREKQATEKKAEEIDKGLPTTEQFKRNVYAFRRIKDPEGPTTRFARRNLTSRNLERWFHAGKIDARQFEAGDRYRSDYEKTGFEQRVTSRYSGGGGSGGGTYSPAMPGTLVQMDAWNRWRAARDDLGSLAAGFDAMAVHDQLVDEIDPADDPVRVYADRTWMLGVRICLDRLVCFYGF
jgi:hypothetical protein